MGRRVLLLCVAVAGVITFCECAILSHEARPLVETDLHLTAADTDSGNWTANLGDIEVKIEHRHGDTSANEGGARKMDVASVVYEKQKGIVESDNNALPKEDTDKFTAKAEIPQENTAEGTDEPTVASKTADESDDTNNEVIDQGSCSRKESTEIYMAPVTSYPISNHLRVKRRIDYDEVCNYKPVRVDRDKFEYFEGVGLFKLDHRHLKWEDAHHACAKVRSYLAVPDTEERVRFFQKLLYRHSDIPAWAILRNQVYVGVSDRYGNGQFKTVEGMPFAPDFPICSSTEPDNTSREKYCVTFHIDGTLRGVPCFYPLPFLCERDIPKSHLTKTASSQKMKPFGRNVFH